MFRNIYISILIVLIPAFSHAQIDPTPGEMAKNYYKEGEDALLNLNFKQAQRLFEKAVKLQPDFNAARRGLGLCYEKQINFEGAVAQYAKILETDSLFSRVLYYQVGEMYYKNGQHQKALDYFRRFERLQSLDFERFGFNGSKELPIEQNYVRKVDGSIRACEMSLDSVKFINVTEVFNLGDGINTKVDEHSPALTNDQLRVYFTRKGLDEDENLFASTFHNNHWTSAKIVRGLNTRLPEGYGSLVRNGRHLFFTACGREEVLGPCDIWEATVDGEEITNIQSIEGFVNSEGWESQVSISCDGSTLFFASEREGGYGGTDIWMSERTSTGIWGEPENLGPKINTSEHEEAPYITNDGKTLYFSSTGHLGMGEQDIFVSWLDDRNQRWSVPINLGPPVNSPYRELGFFLSADGRNGYFSSNRPEGNGGMDIYQFRLNEKLFSDPITFVEGYLKDSVLLTPIADVTVSINGRPPVTTDKEGRFFICVGADEVLDLEVKTRGFKDYHNQFPIPEWNNRRFYEIDLMLQPTFSFLADVTPKSVPDTFTVERSKVKMEYRHTVFFDFDSADLNPSELNTLVNFLEQVKEKNITRIEIIGYADDVGAEIYNFRLSEDRAKEIALFLVNNSLGVDQIYMEGKGEIRDDNDKDRNRRVEVKVETLE
ncbi:MAG: hypothetical protein DHS20C18_52410 [Saprospiraceae bacterium]|nr:MAG: hypothetical protein DHS20C18_52410 [Saprospiraceae bacterium]